jgi:hypothetical protein
VIWSRRFRLVGRVICRKSKKCIQNSRKARGKILFERPRSRWLYTIKKEVKQCWIGEDSKYWRPQITKLWMMSSTHTCSELYSSAAVCVSSLSSVRIIQQPISLLYRQFFTPIVYWMHSNRYKLTTQRFYVRTSKQVLTTSQHFLAELGPATSHIRGTTDHKLWRRNTWKRRSRGSGNEAGGSYAVALIGFDKGQGI